MAKKSDEASANIGMFKKIKLTVAAPIYVADGRGGEESSFISTQHKHKPAYPGIAGDSTSSKGMISATKLGLAWETISLTSVTPRR